MKEEEPSISSSPELEKKYNISEHIMCSECGEIFDTSKEVLGQVEHHAYCKPCYTKMYKQNPRQYAPWELLRKPHSKDALENVFLKKRVSLLEAKLQSVSNKCSEFMKSIFGKTPY